MEKQNKVKLSIIIPNFNHGKSLIDYPSSLDGNKLTWVEFLGVDDCSADNSFNVINDFLSKKNLKIKLIKNKQNIGPGSSRNVGIKSCSGDYITFLDSDDKFATNFFDEIYHYLDNKNELIVFDFLLVNGKKEERNSMLNPIGKEVSIENLVAFVRGAPWGKIYKKDVITSHNVEFLNIKRHEDTPFTKVAISYCHNFIYLDKALYKYNVDQNSLAHDAKYIDADNAKKSIDYILENINPNVPLDVVNYLILVELFYVSLVIRSSKTKRKEWKLLVTNSKKDGLTFKNNKYFQKLPIYKKIAIKNVFYKRYLWTRFANRILFGKN